MYNGVEGLDVILEHILHGLNSAGVVVTWHPAPVRHLGIVHLHLCNAKSDLPDEAKTFFHKVRQVCRPVGRVPVDATNCALNVYFPEYSDVPATTTANVRADTVRVQCLHDVARGPPD